MSFDSTNSWSIKKINAPLGSSVNRPLLRRSQCFSESRRDSKNRNSHILSTTRIRRLNSKAQAPDAPKPFLKPPNFHSSSRPAVEHLACFSVSVDQDLGRLNLAGSSGADGHASVAIM